MNSTNTLTGINQFIGNEEEYRKKNRILLVIFVVAVIGFLVLLYNRPTLADPHMFDDVSFPPTPKDLYNISQFLIKYMDEHFLYTVTAFFYLYILLQAFAIPGPIFLCLLSPTLFGPVKGFFICITVLMLIFLVFVLGSFSLLLNEFRFGQTISVKKIP